MNKILFPRPFRTGKVLFHPLLDTKKAFIHTKSELAEVLLADKLFGHGSPFPVPHS